MDKKNDPTHDKGEEMTEDKALEQGQESSKGEETKPEDKQSTPQSVPYERFQQANERRKQAEKVLADVAQGMIDDLPENMRQLVPDLPPQEKITWLTNAKNAGLFESKAPAKQDSPDPGRPSKKPDFDMNNATPHSLMAHGYK